MGPNDGKKIRLGDLLLRAGVINEDQLRTALAEQKKWGGKLGHVLVELRILSEDLLVKALSKQLGLPRVDLPGLAIPEPALRKLDPAFAQARQVLPISLDATRNLLVVAMADPDNLAVVDELQFSTGCKVKVAIAGERTLAQAIRQHYFGGQAAAGEVANLAAAEEPMQLTAPLGDGEVALGPQPAPVQPAVAPAAAPAAVPTVTIEQRLQRLESQQAKEVQVLKAIVELLIDKGFIAREEYRQRVER